jgi:hypothetical protein
MAVRYRVRLPGIDREHAWDHGVREGWKQTVKLRGYAGCRLDRVALQEGAI